jgi:filamentous hemagglutinin
MSPQGAIPESLASGQAAETRALGALSMAKNTDVWRPSPQQIGSEAFRAIVGDPRYTSRGLARGTVLDSTEKGLVEIKSGSSELDSTYQLRLQTFRSVVEKRHLTLYTSRIVPSSLRRWFSPKGVEVKPLPEPDP